jgi:hypothetical protein
VTGQARTKSGKLRQVVVKKKPPSAEQLRQGACDLAQLLMIYAQTGYWAEFVEPMILQEIKRQRTPLKRPGTDLQRRIALCAWRLWSTGPSLVPKAITAVSKARQAADATDVWPEDADDRAVVRLALEAALTPKEKRGRPQSDVVAVASIFRTLASMPADSRAGLRDGLVEKLLKEAHLLAGLTADGTRQLAPGGLLGDFEDVPELVTRKKATGRVS